MSQSFSFIPQEQVVDSVIALTTQTNINVEITKKGLDVAKDSIKSVGKSLKQFKSHLPLVALIMNLIGYGLSILACGLDSQTPIAFRILSAACLFAMAIGACAIFSFSVTNPVLTLGLALAMIATNLVLKLGETLIEATRLFQIKKAQAAPINSQKTQQQLARLNLKQLTYEQKLDSLLFNLHETTNKQLILAKISKTQAKLLSTQQKIDQLKNSKAHLSLRYAKQTKVIKAKLRSLGSCLLSSILGVVGLFLAPVYPVIGVVLTFTSLGFDCMGLYRKVRAKQRGFKQEKQKRRAETSSKNEQLIDSMSRIINHGIHSKSYDKVMRELIALNSSNDNEFNKAAANEPIESQTKGLKSEQSFFLKTKCANSLRQKQLAPNSANDECKQCNFEGTSQNETLRHPL